MNKTVMRIFCLVLAAILCLGLLAGIVPAHAAELVDYKYGSGSYSNVILNWGQRGTTAAFLSPKAEEFYADNNTSYEQLALLSGSSNTSGVPSSALYKQLQELMRSNQTHETSYNETRGLFRYTDCMNNNDSSISSFYSGKSVGPEWDGGSTWNREHTWPNSKGDASGNGENDIAMLRPTASSENSSRGNTAYGESSGYYDPNKVSNGTYNLHGDVARIMLYVYVRWGNTVNMWGSGGVIESKDVLLKWMVEDPVDTWELARNDSVESIIGTRNVFVDYPELAFALFNEGMPASMITPSGNAAGSGYSISAQVNNAAYGSASVIGRVIDVTPAAGYAFSGYELVSGTATITRDGNRLVVSATSNCTVKINFAAKTPATVTLLHNGIQANTIDCYIGDVITLPGYMATCADGYTFAGWVTNDVAPGSAQPATVHKAGAGYTVTGSTQLKALYAFFDANASEGTAFAKYTGAITEGDYLIAYNDGAMKASVSSANRLDYTDVTVAGGAIEAPAADLIWTVTKEADGTYTLYNAGTGKYAAGNGTKNKAVLKTAVDDSAKWTVSGTSTYEFVNKGNAAAGVNSNLRRNEAYGFACYSTQTGGALTLYKRASGASTYTTTIAGWTPGELTTTSIKEAIAIGSALADGTFTSDKYYVTGVITEVYSSIYGNLYIADSDGNVLNIYGTYDASGATRYDGMSVKPVAGDTVTLYGVIGNYGGTAEMKNAWIVDHVPGDGSVDIPNIPTTTVTLVDVPQTGVAYKFGMTQGNLNNKVFYINGTTASTYYMGTSEVATSGLDVYLEQTTGGYYMYAMVSGAKKYINMIVSGTHVNGGYEDAPSTVYTYDTASKTVVATVNEGLYWFGTRNDKEYTSVGPVLVEYEGFYCNFYQVETTQPEPPIDTPKNGWIKEGDKWYYYQDNVKVTNKWMQDTTGWCYLGTDGAMVTNTWAKDGTGWCWLDASGYMVYGQWVEAGGNKYYVNANGYRVTGEQTIDGKSCYFDENGVYKVRYTITFKNDNGNILSSKLYFAGETVQVPADPTKAADADYTYTFAGWDKSVTPADSDATYTATYTKTKIEKPAKNGWIMEGGKWYYYENDVKATNKWAKDGTGWCYLDANGQIVTGRWVKDSIGWRYVDANGYMVTNRWIADSVGWCYVGEDGYMITNAWAKDSQGWCWIGDAGYIVYSQWIENSGNRYYVNSRGYRVTGEQTIDGESCYFDENGVYKVRYTVTFKNADGTVLSTKLYFAGETVQAPADPTKSPDANYTYTFAGWDKEIVPVAGDATYTATYTATERPAGSQHGWVKENGKWYYYEQGVMVTNKWKKDSKGWCYLGANGAMVTNRWVKDSVGWCYVGGDGYCLTNTWKADSQGWCYLDASGRMVYNRWVKDSVGWCYVGAKGYMVTNAWAKDSMGWYWMGADGYAIKNTSKVIDGKRYYFNASGLCTNP